MNIIALYKHLTPVSLVSETTPTEPGGPGTPGRPSAPGKPTNKNTTKIVLNKRHYLPIGPGIQYIAVVVVVDAVVSIVVL